MSEMIIFAPVKNKSLHILLIAIIALTTTMVSCYEDSSCNQNTETGINIKVLNSGADASTDIDSIDYSKSIDWKITKINDTSSLVNSKNIAYSTGIPLDMNNDSIKFLFNIKNTTDSLYRVDTVVFNYIQTELEALSINCGYAPTFNIYGGHHSTRALDSISIQDTIVNTELTLTNVSFYY